MKKIIAVLAMLCLMCFLSSSLANDLALDATENGTSGLETKQATIDVNGSQITFSYPANCYVQVEQLNSRESYADIIPVENQSPVIANNFFQPDVKIIWFTDGSDTIKKLQANNPQATCSFLNRELTLFEIYSSNDSAWPHCLQVVITKPDGTTLFVQSENRSIGDTDEILYTIVSSVAEDAAPLLSRLNMPSDEKVEVQHTYWVNPQGGTKYHWVHRCPSIHPKYYDVMIEITEDQLSMDPYNMLSPCSVCQGLDEEDIELASQAERPSETSHSSDSIKEQVIQTAKDHLTEIYGYSEEKADQFVFLYDDYAGVLQFWPDENHSAYCYELNFAPDTGKTEFPRTPFGPTKYENYPGEGNVRRVADLFAEKDFLHNWDATAIQEFSNEVYRFDEVRPNQVLADGLKNGNIPASDAIHEFFLSCYGPEEDWTNATTWWLKELMGEDTNSPATAAGKGEKITHEKDEVLKLDLEHNRRCTVRYCVEQIPEEANLQRFTDQGWTLKEGILAEYSDPNEEGFGDSFDRGLFILEKDGSRMGIVLTRDGKAWKPHPVGPCVLADRDFVIIYQESGFNSVFRFEYEPKNGETITCNATVYDGLLHLENYSVTNDETGESFHLYLGDSGRWTWMENGPEGRRQGSEYAYISPVDAMMRFIELPDSMNSFSAWNKVPFPTGYAMTSGVHLRAKTSSRSTDLGMLNPGTIVQILGTAEGDPFDWYHVKLGLLEGYVSSQYVRADDTGEPVDSVVNPLPVAELVKDTDLKSGTGWFDRATMKVPVGVRMHVLFEKDGWYYVVVPSDEPSFCMDVDGAYGYIPKDAVRTGATVYELDWMDE